MCFACRAADLLPSFTREGALAALARLEAGAVSDNEALNLAAALIAWSDEPESRYCCEPADAAPASLESEPT